MKKYKVIAILGESGSGKDTLVAKLDQDFFHRIITATTRPKRDYEIDGVTYQFMTPEEFKATDFIESKEFNNWFYGTPYDSLVEDKINVAVITPAGLVSYLANDKIELLNAYYLKVPAKERLVRQLSREEEPNIDEIIRRYSSDKIDFRNIENIPEIVTPLDNSNLNAMLNNIQRIHRDNIG